MLADHFKQKQALSKPLYLTVRIVPKSLYTEFVEVMGDGSYKIRVAAPPEKGKANAELVRFLKKELGIRAIAIVSGKTDRIKLIRIDWGTD